MRFLFPLLLFGACSPMESEALKPFPMPDLDGEGTFAVASERPERPRLRYRDGQVSVNSSCAIRLTNKLNPVIPPMYVNGAPIGFC